MNAAVSQPMRTNVASCLHKPPLSFRHVLLHHSLIVERFEQTTSKPTRQRALHGREQLKSGLGNATKPPTIAAPKGEH